MLLVSLCLGCGGTSQAPTLTTQEPPLPSPWDSELPGFIEEALAEWGVPGTAVAVVSSEGILFARGFGHANSATQHAFTMDTVFPIASISKTFTAAAIGYLVDQGSLSWDDPVVEHDPTFALADPYFTQHVTIRDLLSHRAGFGEDAAFAYVIESVMGRGTCSREGLLDFARGLEPAYGFREGVAYSNVAFVFLTNVIENVSGQPWSEFIHDTLLSPLGMSRTVVGLDAFDSLDNVALPHELDPEGEVAPRPLPPFGTCLEGSGDIFTSASDLSTFVRMILNGGRHEGHQILRPETVTEMLSPQTLLDPGPFLTQHMGADFYAYTLGWEILQYKGTTLVRMGGSGPGYQSAVMVLPNENVGVLVFQNYSPALFHVSAAYEILDRYIEASETDWISVFRAVIPAIPEREAVPLSAEPEDYLGAYLNDGGWPREIVLQDNELFLAGTSPMGGGPPGVGLARLFGLEEDTLFIKTADAVFHFFRHENEAILGFVEHFAGSESRYRRQ
jgi:CubicO group peptidase (beta-lactamase class C family)